MKHTLYVITFHGEFRSICLLYDTKGFSATMNHILRDETVAFFFGCMGWYGFTIGYVNTVSKNAAIQFVGKNNDHSLAMRADQLQHE